MRPRQTTIAVFAAALLLSGAAVSPAHADHNSDEDEEGITALVTENVPTWSAASAVVDGVMARIGHLHNDPDTTAADEEKDVRSFFNGKSGAFETYVNKRTTASTNQNVLKITYEVDGETASHYLVADVNGSDYTNATIAKSTDRPVDETCTLSGSAAVNAKEELKAFHDEYVTSDKDAPKSYWVHKRMEYVGSDVSCSFLDQ